MAVKEVAIATWSGGTAYSRVEIKESGRNNAAGWIDVYWWHGTRSTHGSVSGTWDWARSGVVSGSGSVGAATGTRMIGSGTKRYTCDANGNFANRAMNQSLDVYYGSGSANQTISFARAPLAPTNIAPTGSNIAVTSARITASVSSHGHGTSSSYNIRYRKQGSDTWIERGWGGNTWDLTGLTPGSVYEMSSIARNNNNDTNSWTGTYTFTLLPAPNTSQQLLSITGVL